MPLAAWVVADFPRVQFSCISSEAQHSLSTATNWNLPPHHNHVQVYPVTATGSPIRSRRSWLSFGDDNDPLLRPTCPTSSRWDTVRHPRTLQSVPKHQITEQSSHWSKNTCHYTDKSEQAKRAICITHVSISWNKIVRDIDTCPHERGFIPRLRVQITEMN